MTRRHSNAYNMFILVLTVFSLVAMVLLLLPLEPQVQQLLFVYDQVICVIFLVDFAYNLTGSRPKTQYFIRERGWLDLLGSIPSLGISNFTVLFRLARLSRLARIARLFGGAKRRELIDDVVNNRGQYAAFITILSAGLVLSVGSVLILMFESRSQDANITTGGDALWWGVVTITTVGYGDFYPVTSLGRLTAFVVMLAGVGIIGALASILASVLVPPPTTHGDEDGAPAAPGPSDPAVAAELAALRAEVQALREALAPPGVAPGPPAILDPAVGPAPGA